MAFACFAGLFPSSALTRVFAVGALFLGAAAGHASAAGCGQPMASGRHAMTIQSTDAARSGVYFIPSSYTGDKKVSVVFDFHGSNSNPNGQLDRSSWDKVAEREGFIVVALQGSLPGKLPHTYAWNVPYVTTQPDGLDEIGFIRAALGQVKQEFCVDPARIYASGYSGGGRMLSSFLCSGGDDFASAGFVHSLRAGRPVEIEGKWAPDSANCQPSRPISIMAFAGEKDNANPYAGGGKPYWQYGFKTAVKRWTELDGCTGNGVTETAGGVTYSLYGTCKNGARIASYVFSNGTHDWPKPGAAQNVVAAAAQAETGVVKVAAVARKPSFDPNIDPASRMWDFFRKADSTDVIATAAPASSKAGVACVVDKTGAADKTGATTGAETQGTTCINSQPINTRHSGQGAQDAL